MTPGRPSSAGGGEASRNWATVLDELEGEVLAAESSLRSDRDDEIAAWGRRAEDFKDRIADWDVRLATRRKTLTRQFTAMETALSSLKNQSSWLAGQLGSLSG